MHKYRYIFGLLITLLILQACQNTDNEQWVEIASLNIQKSNLQTIQFLNGDLIKRVDDPVEWAACTEPAYCTYENEPLQEGFGYLYNGYAIEDPRGICPEGWHLMTENEWSIVSQEFGGDSVAGECLKSTEFWEGTTGKLRATSKMEVFPSGNRKPDGSYNGLNQSAVFWTNSSCDDSKYTTKYVGRYYWNIKTKCAPKNYAFSCRCVLD